MKQQFQENVDWLGRRIPPPQEKKFASTSDAAKKTAPRMTVSERSKKTGSVGLANEMRPGLGSRRVAAGAGDADVTASAPKAPKAKRKSRTSKRGYEEPSPAPREQASDSLAHEEERQTGMSGQSSGT